MNGLQPQAPCHSPHRRDGADAVGFPDEAAARTRVNPEESMSMFRSASALPTSGRCLYSPPDFPAKLARGGRRSRGIEVDEGVGDPGGTAEALRKTLGLMDALMDNAPVGIVLTRERRITRYNPKFRELFGFAGDEGMGLPGRVIYRSDDDYAALGRRRSP